MPINIAERMNEIIARLEGGGFNGLRFHDIDREDENSWGPDYALVDNLFMDEDFGDHSEYFDHAQLAYDLKKMIEGEFNEPGITVSWHDQNLGGVEIYREEL